MKVDRQVRQERLATVPETASLLGKAGGDAEAPRTFAAREPQQRGRLWPYVGGCLMLGLLAMYLLGALPFGGSSSSWIRSLPKARHNPAAKLPDQPPLTTQLDAVVSQLEGGKPKPGGGDSRVVKGASSEAESSKLDSSAEVTAERDSAAAAADANPADSAVAAGEGAAAAAAQPAKADASAQGKATPADEAASAKQGAADASDEGMQQAAAATNAADERSGSATPDAEDAASERSPSGKTIGSGKASTSAQGSVKDNSADTKHGAAENVAAVAASDDSAGENENFLSSSSGGSDAGGKPSNVAASSKGQAQKSAGGEAAAGSKSRGSEAAGDSIAEKTAGKDSRAGKQAAPQQPKSPKSDSADGSSKASSGAAAADGEGAADAAGGSSDGTEPVEADGSGSRSGSSGGGGGLARATARDEAALLADGEAKEAQPDSATGSSDGEGKRAAASDGDAESLAGADGNEAADSEASAEPAAPSKDKATGGGGGGGGGGGKGAADSKASAKAAQQSKAATQQAPAADGKEGGQAGSSGQGAAAGAGGGNGGAAGATKGGGNAPPDTAAARPKSSSSGSSDEAAADASESKAKNSGGSSGSDSSNSKGSDDAESSGRNTDGKDRKEAAAAEQAAGDQGAEKRAGRKEAAGQRGSPRSERTTLATQAGSQGKRAAALEGCLDFAPAGCQVVPGQKEPLQFPKCDDPPGHKTKGGADCSFDLAAELKPCPITGAGLYFEREKGKQGCKMPPFWRDRGGEPSCASDGVCCSGDGIKGAWQDAAADKEFNVLQFKEDKSMGCHFHEYTRRQVLQCLTNTTVVLWGDSMVRQLFNRVPSLFRGDRRTFDPQRWRAERYDACEAADVRTMAPAFDGLSPKDDHYYLWGLADLTDKPHPFLSLEEAPRTELLDMVDPNAKPKDFPKQTCGQTRPASFQYIPATGFWPQYRFGGYYLKTHKGDLSQSVWVSQVGFWDLDSKEPDAPFLKTMQEALDRGLKQLIIILVPTRLVGVDERDPRRWILRGRNDFMRRWAANDTSGRTAILDMDSLSMAPAAPTGLVGNWTDWHYQCKFLWVDEHPGKNISAAEFAPQSHNWLDPAGWTLGSLQANVMRDCIDDMNRIVLNVLWNMLCNRRD